MPGELKPGDRFLDRFQIKYLSAEGGMASIYVAADHISGHNIAVKALYPYYCDNDIIRQRFLEEGNIQSMLRHPNIIRVFDVMEEPALAILMEYVEGPTLDEFLAENGPMTTQQVVDVIIPVMSAVGLAHSRGIIHRDIKPSNILLDNSDLHTPKILDFGVAKIKGNLQELTATGTTVGTLHYMSPEQIVGSKNIDGRADVYSLGVTMYKLVTGEVPFNAPTEFALMMAQVEAPPLPPRNLRSDLSPELEKIILKAMAKKPGDRFQTIRDFTSAMLSLRVEPERTVSDTISGTFSSHLIDFALMADQVALDRTSDSGFFVLTEGDIDFGGELTNQTMEIEATIKMERGGGRTAPIEASPEHTEELSNSAVIRLTKASGALLENEDIPNVETVPIPSLQQRLAQSDRSLKASELSTESTRPSRPSNVISERDIQAFAVEDEKDTVSIDKRLAIAKIQERQSRDSGALRSGVHVADMGVDSKDMTAPKIPERDYRAALQREERRPSPSGRVERVSGPKEVMGKNPADTNERTQLRDGSKVRQRLEERRQREARESIARRESQPVQMRDALPKPSRESQPLQSRESRPFQSGPSHVAGVSPSSDPYEDGRMHLPARPAEGSQRVAMNIGQTRLPMKTDLAPKSKASPTLVIIGIVAFFVIVVVMILLAALKLT